MRQDQVASLIYQGRLAKRDVLEDGSAQRRKKEIRDVKSPLGSQLRVASHLELLSTTLSIPYTTKSPFDERPCGSLSATPACPMAIVCLFPIPCESAMIR